MKLASLYRLARKARGTQTAVAEALGIRRVTIMRRETARSTVTLEAMLALLTLPVIGVGKCQTKNQKRASPIAADSATAPAPRRSRGAGNGSVAGATKLSNQPSISAAQLKITRGKGGLITSTALAD
jgi:transcriptional regulator with XRE-family HTH domain